MANGLTRDWMWSNAVQTAAPRLFRPAGTQARLLAWEPAVDIPKTDAEILVQAAIADDRLIVAGARTYPRDPRTDSILKAERDGC